MPGKNVKFDAETFAALDLLARDRMMTFQEVADEAFRDLLRKHNRPTGAERSAAQERWRLGQGRAAEAAQNQVQAQTVTAWRQHHWQGLRNRSRCNT
jgi:hypothetical protein